MLSVLQNKSISFYIVFNCNFYLSSILYFIASKAVLSVSISDPLYSYATSGTSTSSWATSLSLLLCAREEHKFGFSSWMASILIFCSANGRLDAKTSAILDSYSAVNWSQGAGCYLMWICVLWCKLTAWVADNNNKRIAFIL